MDGAEVGASASIGFFASRRATKQLLGPLTNPLWLNAIAGTAVALLLGLSTMLTITTILPGSPTEVALIATLGLLATAAIALAVSRSRDRRAATTPRSQRDTPETLTPWQRQTWTAPRLELVPAPAVRRSRTLTLALLRGYTIVMIGLLLIKLGTLIPT